jgi:hypothetical protein
MSEIIEFKNNYTLWFHKLNDNNWERKTYRMIYTFGNVKDFWKMFNNLPTVNSFMLFLMKENIFPTYEDPENINGGCWSYRVQRKDLQQVWKLLCIALISNNIENDSNNIITGISINPKNCVLKIWCKETPTDEMHLGFKISGMDLTKFIVMNHKAKSDESKKK